MTRSNAGGLVLAVQPSARGFGWLLFEGDVVPVSWGVARSKSNDNTWSMKRFEKLLNQHQPSVVIMEKFDDEDSHRGDRVRDLAQMMRGCARNREIDTPIYSRAEVGAAVVNDEKATRHTVAVAVGSRLSVLQHHLLPKRKVWEPEHDRQCLFDAAALGITRSRIRTDSPSSYRMSRAASRALGSAGMVRCSRCAQEVSMASTVLSAPKSDVYRAITEKIVAAIEAGVGTFTMPWHGGILSPSFPVNAATNNPYRGVNILALWADATFKRYISGYWASYRQWQTLDAQVRGGERGSLIVFYKDLSRNEEDGEDVGNGGSNPRFVARASYVFNAEQVDGWQPPVPKIKSDVQINDEVAAFIEAIGADVRHGVHAARYRRDLDCIEIPNPELFIGTGTSSATESYHAVLLHELVHYSGGEKRLNREFGKRFADRTYAFEELTAELGAAFLCSAFRLSNEPRPDHAAYVASWLEILNRDTKAIFMAASKAQEAVEYLMQRAAVRAKE